MSFAVKSLVRLRHYAKILESSFPEPADRIRQVVPTTKNHDAPAAIQHGPHLRNRRTP